MSTTTKKRRYPTASSPNESDDDNGEQPSTSTSQLTTKRRGSVAADFASPRLIVSERQQMAVLKQLTAGDESNTGSQSPSSVTPQPRPSKINRRNEHGETIVHIVARKGDLKQLKKILKAGANVNEADNAGWTPLHEAVTKNQFKAARLLLKSGANANAIGHEGQTPLVDAVLNNNPKMAELLLNYSADPSVVDINNLNETMSKVLKRETSVLESSDNDNDDESISPLSPLTSDNDFEHDDKQSFHSTLVEQLDKNILQRSTILKFQHKQPIQRFRERSPSHSKIRTMSGNTDSSTIKNPYDFESEEEGEIREPPNEISDEQKKKPLKKQEHVKQRANSGGSSQFSETILLKKRSNQKEQDQQRSKSNISDDEQLQHIYRVPPLKIVLARAVVQKPSENESLNSSIMDNENSLSIDTSIPIIEQNDKLLSTVTSNSPIVSPEISQENLSQRTNLEEIHSPLYQSHSPRRIISSILDTVIRQIELNDDENNNNDDNNNNNNNNQLNSLPIIEDDQLEVEEDIDDDDEEENADEDEEIETETRTEQDHPEKITINKTNKIEKDRPTTMIKSSLSSSSTSKNDLKPITRTLRSHARKKFNLSTLNQTLSNSTQNLRRVSNRRRALENKLLIPTATSNEKKRKVLSDRIKKDSTTINDDNHTSSNSDDQIIENSVEKSLTNSNNDELSSCSSTGPTDGGSSTNSSTANNKQVNSSTDIDSLPPNKRRLRERNVAFNNLTSDQPPSQPTTTNSDSLLNEVNQTRELPVNSIKQFLEIRQQIDKRHETMLNDHVIPKIPKDFSQTTMAKKSYLISPEVSSYSSSTPASIGIRRLFPPNDLDLHLAEVFSKQEDERYKMKIRHQVERDKLILSHEQEILRLHGNATRSSNNQDIPFSYCSLLKDNEVYNNPSIQLPEKLLNNDFTNTDLGKRGKNRWNGRSFIKWLEDSNLKYKRLSCELNERQRLEAETLYSMQRMVWLKHLPKESANLSSSGRLGYLLSERYLPKVDINPNFWTSWETSPF